MRRMLVKATPPALVTLLVLAPAAFASEGRGFYGATNDKVVTNAGFILILFFPTFIFVASRIQAHLDRRKKARLKAAKAQMGNSYLRGGW
jgi:hypothetical protein